MSRPLSVYDVVNSAERELGITQSDLQSVIGAPDHDVAQMVSLLSAVADEVLINEPYKESLGDGFWLRGVDGATKPSPTADSDVVLFDGRTAIEGLKFRFLKAKGLEYGEEMRSFADRMNRVAASTNARILDLDIDTGRVV